jgi:hypothetical protein
MNQVLNTRPRTRRREFQQANPLVLRVRDGLANGEP